MTDTPHSHRATPEQWAEIEASGLPGTGNWGQPACIFNACLLELRARVEALEAAQQPPAVKESLTVPPEADLALIGIVAEQQHAVAEKSSAAQSPDPQTLHTIAMRMVDTLELDVNVLPEICDTLRRAIREPAPCPHIRSSDEGTSYCELAEQAAQQQPSAQPPASLSLLDEVAWVIGLVDETLNWHPEARRAVAVIVRRLREHGSPTIANWLEQEAAR